MHWSTKEAKHSDSTLSHSFNDKKGLWKSLHNKFYSVTYVNQYRCISNYVRTRIDKTAHYLHINMIKKCIQLTVYKKATLFNAAAIEMSGFRFFLFALDARKHNFFTPIDGCETQSNVKKIQHNGQEFQLIQFNSEYKNQAIKSHTKENETLLLFAILDHSNKQCQWKRKSFNNIGCLQELNKVIWNADKRSQFIPKIYKLLKHFPNAFGKRELLISFTFYCAIVKNPPRINQSRFESVSFYVSYIWWCM